jgi:hypothetical protein
MFHVTQWIPADVLQGFPLHKGHGGGVGAVGVTLPNDHLVDIEVFRKQKIIKQR